MPSGKQLIPIQNEDFYFWQANFVNRVVINQVAWNMPAANLAEPSRYLSGKSALFT